MFCSVTVFEGKASQQAATASLHNLHKIYMFVHSNFKSTER